MSRSSITEGAVGYRRGVIFGLTMAEVFMLLIFCLLLYLALVGKQLRKAEELLKNATPNEEIIDLKDYELVPIPEWTEMTSAIEKYEEFSESLSGYELVPINEWTEITSTVKKYDKMSKNLSDYELVPIDEWTEITSNVKKYEQQLQEVATNKPEGNNWPPIISLADAKDYSFTVGSAVLSESFEAKLKTEIAQKILETLKEYDADLIEVIGHTDRQPMGRSKKNTNLDYIGMEYFDTTSSTALEVSDNAGLGFARAMSVTKELMQVPSLLSYTILPYSGAHFISPNEEMSTGDEIIDSSELRRIEIRVRRKNPNEN